MTKRILALLAALTLSVSLMAGCTKDDGGSSEKDPSSVTETPDNSSEEESSMAPVSADPIDVKQGPTEEMLERSVLDKGDTSRLAQKLQNTIDNPKQITKIVFMGDSITAGSVTNNSSNQYVNQFKTWWEENISFYVDVVNAGIGATDSHLGVHRVQRDVLDLNPDIIFIEFINDADNEFYKASMDSLIRKCLSAENNPAVILVEMTMEDGTCPQNVHSEIAKAYGVPVISYHDAVLPEVQAGSIKWKDISPDNIHPNDDGHVLLAKLLTSFVSSVKDNLENESKDVKAFDAESPTGDIYKNAYLANRTTETVNVTDEGSFTGVCEFQGKFSDGWSTTTGGSMTFEVEAQNIGLVYNKNVDGTYGTAKIIVDGLEVSSVNADFTGGWGSYACSVEVFKSDAPAKHTVTIEVSGDEKPNFDIYSLLIS